jgi:hypothetical protein
MAGDRQELVLGRYRLGRLIGRGATSTVRRAEDVRARRAVAVKTVPADPDLFARADVEIRAAQRLDHPGVVRLLDAGEGDDCLHLVWELVEGPSLLAVLADGRPADAWSLERIAEVLDALAHAHARGVVHRDVKPANVLVDRDGHARLSDFGVARLTDEAGVTAAGSIVGTVAYMAPEQAQGHRALPASDVYSACLVLYELLTGANPHNHRSPAEAVRRAAGGDLPPLRAARPDLPAEVAAAVEAGLHPDPAARPAPGALADALRRASTATDGRGRRIDAGRRLLPAAASAAVTGALAAAALSAWSGLRPGEVAIGAALAGGAAVARPRAAALAVVAVAAALLGRDAPVAGVVLALLGAGVLLTGRGQGRWIVLPALGPLAAWLGLLPVAAALTAGVPGWPRRVWAVGWGVALTFAWQLWTPGAGFLAGPGPARSASTSLLGVDAPADAADRLWPLLEGQSWLLWQAAVLVAAALTAPLLLRFAVGSPRGTAAGVWGIGLVFAATVVSPDPATTLAATLPGVVLVVAWALRPWRTLGRLGGEPASATLRGPV